MSVPRPDAPPNASYANSTANGGGSYELSPSDSEDAAANAAREAADADEADDVVGVSMGYTQSRLKARSTPAEEKNRAMELGGEDFGGGDHHGLFTSEITAEPESLSDDSKPPAPATKETSRSSFTKSILKNTLPLRPRASSGDSQTRYRALKKFLPSLHIRTGSLSSLSQRRSRSVSSRLNLDQEAPSPSPSGASPADSSAVEEPIGTLKPLEAPSASTRGKHSFARRPSATSSGSNLTLRRSSSDRSLYLRASSTASSLDQRLQFEHVHSMTNSRFRAIKDSLQDSSSRLLSMPSLHLQDLRSEWGSKPFLSDASNRRSLTSAADESQTASPAAPVERRGRSEDGPPRTRSPRSSTASTYPILTEAMSELTGDVVVMGGYRGSVLRSAKPPHRQLWVPMKVGLNLRKVDLEVGLTHEDEERMEETIIPDGVLSHVGPVDICRRLLKRLQKCDNSVRGELRAWNYGYDWRLSPHLLSQRLIRFLEGLPCNAPDVPPHKRGAYVIAHSLGGLIARHAVNQRPELFAGVLYAGVPQHCVNILGPLRNGDDVLLSSRVLTAQVNFTFRTSYALLPEEGHCFIDKRTKEEYILDFFDPRTWDEYRLSPCINPALPPPTSSSFSSFPSSHGLKVGKRFSAVLGNGDNNTPTDDSSTTALPTTGALPGAGEGLVGPTTTPRGSSSHPPSSQTVTIPRDKAQAYLTRTLDEVLLFKKQTSFNPSHHEKNLYPPFAVLYSKSIPTVYGARVASKEHIKYNDAFDDLAFAAGDGVCLASAAMLPPGYRIIKDGLVKTERGHVGLLGDLEAVGQCLRALVRGRKEGVGVPQS